MTSEITSTRIALVTGAAQGIGQCIALRLADDGLDVAVNDLPSKSEQLDDVLKQIQAKGRRAITAYGDVSKEDDVSSMISHVAETLGGLDVMVANAGIFKVGSLVELSTDDWDAVFAVNLRGLMFCYKYAARQMIKQGRGGRIIGASSEAGRSGKPLAGAYTATKFAIRGLTQTAAQELAPHKITVNAYAPGMIITTISLHPDDEINGGFGSTYLKALGLPLDTPRAGPDSVASAVSYLAKPESYFITGQTISMNGGIGFD